MSELGSIKARFWLNKKSLCIFCVYRGISLTMRIPRDAEGEIDRKSAELLIGNMTDTLREGVKEIYVQSQNRGLQAELDALFNKEKDDGGTTA